MNLTLKDIEDVQRQIDELKKGATLECVARENKNDRLRSYGK